MCPDVSVWLAKAKRMQPPAKAGAFRNRQVWSPVHRVPVALGGRCAAPIAPPAAAAPGEVSVTFGYVQAEGSGSPAQPLQCDLGGAWVRVGHGSAGGLQWLRCDSGGKGLSVALWQSRPVAGMALLHEPAHTQLPREPESAVMADKGPGCHTVSRRWDSSEQASQGLGRQALGARPPSLSVWGALVRKAQRRCGPAGRWGPGAVASGTSLWQGNQSSLVQLRLVSLRDQETLLPSRSLFAFG